jgi:hypothetical protein
VGTGVRVRGKGRRELAPEGRDVYRLAGSFSLLRSSVGAQPPLPFEITICDLHCQVSLLPERDPWGAIIAINISLRWSENEIDCGRDARGPSEVIEPMSDE